MEAAAIVLAAGAGTRMNSKKPKVAHSVLGKPLVRWVVDAAHRADIQRIVCVVGHAREQVEPLVMNDTKVVVQNERLGTGNAVAVCAEALSGYTGSVVVLSGDCPLIEATTIRRLVEMRQSENAAAVVLSMNLSNPFGYGRIVRDGEGSFKRIVEQKDATEEEASLTECNAGFYCFEAPLLFSALAQVDNKNAQGEYYLTDVLALCQRAGKKVLALKTQKISECLGVNSRVQLAEVTKQAQRRINEKHMLSGVSMPDPEQVWIGPDVHIQRDVELLPQTFLWGTTFIGEDSIIGPNSRLTNTVVGRGCVMEETVALEARIDDNASCGPRAYLRSGAHLCENAKAGTHVEIKNSTIGKGSKVPHLSYIGDTTMGGGVNIGAGSITCNYDGKTKHPTFIGDDAFIGSDTMMVAPVTIGSGALVGAGSVITKDVQANSLALSRSEQHEIPDWASKKRKGAQ